MWPKIIDEMIAGLPTNSAQRLELREFAAQVDALKKENEDLKSKLAALQPVAGVDAEAAQVLSHLAKGGGELTCYAIAASSGVGLERVKRHLGYLRKLKFVQWSRAQTDDSDPPHRITDKGSEFLYKQGMI